MRGIEHDLIPGATLPNRAAYRTNLEETKEIQRQVQDLLDRGYVRESLSPYIVLVLLVPVVGQNPPTSSNRQHEEPRGSRDYWSALVPRSTAQDPAHDLASRLLGVPSDLVPDREGVEVISVSFLHTQIHSNISPSRDRLIG
jgi:hypothetical protein